MRDNSFDRTIERNYLQKWRFLIPEYEAVKAGRSTSFRRVGDFYRHHGTCSQTFRKYYNRYLRSGEEADLLPQRRDLWFARTTEGILEGGDIHLFDVRTRMPFKYGIATMTHSSHAFVRVRLVLDRNVVTGIAAC